jgi:lipopolysaccharide transport system permease protein
MNHEEALKEWYLTIEPQNSLFKLNLKVVWRYRDLLSLLAKRDFTSFYKQTILGPLWIFIQPLFTTISRDIERWLAKVRGKKINF